ncbi:MAG TPA: cytochrome c biogenesis protein CcdA [Bacteroidia bacterium]|nr:cytochrome c biogenesis protein CcdA [Bacteroidia bacterium]
MKRFLTALFTTGILAFSFAQPKDYVTWTYSQKKISANEAELSFVAKIEPQWHLYSQVKTVKPPLKPTSFRFAESQDYKLLGRTVEPKPIVREEPVFGNLIVRFFENTATFRQKIKVLNEGPVEVKGTIDGMACNERVCQNFAPEIDFSFNVGGNAPVPNTSAPALGDIFKSGSGQNKQYVSWSFSQKKIGADEFELTFTAKIEPSWHLYSQIETPDGPLPTLFEFEKSGDYKLIGKTIEPKPIEHAEPVFDNLVVRYFENKAIFKQKVKVLSNKPVVIKGFIDGMACNESQCQKFSPPPEFVFTLEGAPVAAGPEVAEPDSIASSPLQNTVTPQTTSLPEPESATIVASKEPLGSSEDGEKRSYLGLFIAGFLGGLLALLTPCVFPMIPMTVSFFTKQSKTKIAGIRNALIYSVSIIVIYVALGLGVTFIFGADALNNLATNVWFNLAFFVLLVVFAVSFLGAFEITLPSGFVNKMDAKSDKGGLIGIFFMAFTLGLVSFSCTGPIIGNLLVIAASTGALAGPFFGMFGFSLALALPFGLFAAFPGWLNSLPKSGGWLNSVKVVLGFLELALALKFLSQADLVVQAGYVTREIFIAIWIVIFALLGAYLMGWFKLSHDSDLKHISVGRLMMAIVTFSFTIYLIPGLWGAPLKLISAFPPPDFYSESPEGFGGKKTETSGTNEKNLDMPEHAHRGPNGIQAFDDYYLALSYAKTVNKPLLLDFTGWACVNCRKMESLVWSDSDVKRKLSEDFVLVSLYVDDKKTLPDELKERVTWNGSERTLSTVGSRWSYLQNNKYQSSTQPQYWIIDANENRLSDSTSYDPDIAKYIQWLDAGLKKFAAQKNN